MSQPRSTLIAFTILVLGVAVSAPAQIPTSLTVSGGADAIGGQSKTGQVTLSGPAPSGGFVVSLHSNHSAATVPASLTVPAGALNASFTITVLVPQSTVTVLLTATGGGMSASRSLTVFAFIPGSVALTPSSSVGGAPVTGVVTLNQPAPSGGVVVQLTSSNPGVATVPASVSVPAGMPTASFAVTTVAVAQPSTVTITARAGGESRTRQLTIGTNGPTAISFSPSSVHGGQSSTGTVSLRTPAPPGGLEVSLESSVTQLVTVPAKVTVAPGATTASFRVTTQLTTFNTPVPITASAGGVVVSARLTYLAAVPALSAVTFVPNPATGGTSAGQLSLTLPAPNGGLAVRLVSSDPAIATVPSGVTVPAGMTTANFTVGTVAVAQAVTVTITGFSSGGESKAASLTVVPVTLASLILSPPSIEGGASSTGRVRLNGVAASGGFVVTLTHSGHGVVSMPASVTIPAGAATASFTISAKRVSARSSVKVTATMGGVSQTTGLTITP